jgi:ectoine hydroxylase
MMEMKDCYPTRGGQEATISPRLDPVAYQDWKPYAPITAKQLSHFDEQGFLVLDGLFDEDEIAQMQQAAFTLLKDPEGIDEQTVILEPHDREVRSIFRIHRQCPSMRRLASDERIAGIVRFLLDDDVYIHQSRLNFKPGFNGTEFYWHSDFETWHAEDGMPRMRAISASILLTENSEQNGPLMVIPGSHLHFLSCQGETPEDHYRASLRKQEVGTPDPESLSRLVAQGGLRSIPGKPGQVILFDCNLMHGSNGNITPFPRSNAFFVYNAICNRIGRPFSARHPRPDFIAERLIEPVRPVRDSLLTEPA